MDLAEVLTAIDGSGPRLDVAALVALDPRDLLQLVREVEVIARRLDAVRTVLADAVDRSGAHGVDGHRTAKAALVHLGRLSGPEAHRRVRTARALRSLPAVGAAFAAGTVPTELAHGIGRAAANPRGAAFLEPADAVFAEQAAREPHDAFVAWLGEWERLADADGAAHDAEAAHRRRGVTLVQNRLDGSWLLRGQFGALQGAVLADVLDGFTAAEATADHDDATARFGPGATAAQWARTPTQRRADALVALARAAAGAGAGGDGRQAQPLVNIVIDEASFTHAIDLARNGTTGSDPTLSPAGGAGGDLSDLAGRICATTSGHRLHPHDALAAALIGHVRRVVIDGHGRVIDLGRRRRLFTGASRDAAQLQAAIAGHGTTRCLWSGCSASPTWLQVDHHHPWHRDGPTDVANSVLLCGHHNRLKETGYTPTRGPDGTWTLTRPDGTHITPAA